MAAFQNVSLTAPTDYSAEQQSIERRRKLAESLQAQSQVQEPSQTAGGWVIPTSPLSGLAKALQAYGGVVGQKNANKEEKELAAKYQTDAQRVLSESLGALNGAPARTEQQPVNTSQEGTGSFDMSGSAGPATAPVNVPAQAPDAMKALTIAMQHPQAAQVMSPLAMKAIEQQQGQQDIEQAIARAKGPQAAPTGVSDASATATGAPWAAASANPQAAPANSNSAVVAALMRSPNPQAQAYGKFLAAQGETHGNVQYDQSGKAFVLTKDGKPQYLPGVTEHIPLAKQEELKQARELHATPSGSAVLSNSLGNAHLAETRRHNQATEGDPAVIESTAKAIANGELAPLSGFALARPQGREIMSRVAAIAQESGKPYDPTQFATRQKAEKDFATGKQGQAVKSFNVSIAHLDTLDQLSDALKNGNVQAFNKIGNIVATQTGQPAPTNFEAAKKIVADEIVKAIVGSGGGVGDREQAAKTISAASSPAQLKGVINTYKELMKGQLGGLRQQYEQTTGKKDFDRFLSTGAQGAAHTPASSSAQVVKWGDLK